MTTYIEKEADRLHQSRLARQQAAIREIEMATAEQTAAFKEASQPLADLLAEDEADENVQRRAAVEALEGLWEAREARKLYEALEKSSRQAVDAFFQGHPEERELFDNEKGYRAHFRSGGTTDLYDSALAVKERNPALYRRLEELGCLGIDEKMVKNAIQKGWITTGDIEHIRHQIERTPSLLVDKTG